MITYKRKPISLKTRKLQLFPLQNDPCASMFQMHLFRKDAESQTEAFSAAVTTERSVDTQKGEDTPDPVTSTPLKKPSANVLSNVTSRIRYGAAWERNLRLYEYTLPHLHDPEQKRSYIWQGQALFPDFC
ncbi:uncharacterized protein [Apostichopus japonicus]|uniref:uncharacterized protein isoform X2 n=1 Tax=Stichopus japonicus TaxID=307972 RepID=UPI003AB1B47D